MAMLDLHVGILEEFASVAFTAVQREFALTVIEGRRRRAIEYRREYDRRPLVRARKYAYRRRLSRRVDEELKAIRSQLATWSMPPVSARVVGRCEGCGRELVLREGCHRPTLHRCALREMARPL